MLQQNHVLSCDWGTTSFRLRLIDTGTKSCLAKVSSDRGNATVFSKWKSQPDANRIHFYLRYLKEAIDELASLTDIPVNNLSVLISGMASSSIGMKELPYAELPFTLDGRSVHAEWIDAAQVLENAVLLISGVQQHDDVMRGEETQLIGIASLMNLPTDGNLLFILPGTHSKHIFVSKHQVDHFNTFMTGEVFEVLIRHSILKHAIAEPESIIITDQEEKSFREGVKKGLESSLLSALFSVRINHLKKYFSVHQNYYYLSGLLIGSEINHIRHGKKWNLVLCSSGNLQRLYQSAFEYAGLSDQTIIVTSEVLDNAAAAGQLKIFENTAPKTN